MIKYPPRTTTTAVLLCGLMTANTAFASGFRIPEASIAGLGASNALVADTSTAGALPYNPAAMAFQNQRVLTVGLINVWPEFERPTRIWATLRRARVRPARYCQAVISPTTLIQKRAGGFPSIRPSAWKPNGLMKLLPILIIPALRPLTRMSPNKASWSWLTSIPILPFS